MSKHIFANHVLMFSIVQQHRLSINGAALCLVSDCNQMVLLLDRAVDTQGTGSMLRL